MLTLLKNLDCFAPEHIGRNDILICSKKIYKINNEINITDLQLFTEIIDCAGLYAFPGIIDQHVHIIGGGGEKGFKSRIAEIDIQDCLNAGVTTVAGLLGADSCCRSMETLFAKAKSLEAQGITTYIYSGSYSIPPVNLTGDIVRDMVLIDKVIGVGEIAVSDHRSSHAGIEQIIKIASDAHLGGLLGGKAGVVHLHIGDGKMGLGPLFQMTEESDLPFELFVPTHLNRSPALFGQAMEYCRAGGYIDLTAGETIGVSVPDAVRYMIDNNMDLSKVTVSSDANGSTPDGGVNRISTLYEDIVSCMIDKAIDPSKAISLVTKNVSKLLKLYPAKGTLRECCDADILITDKKYNIKKLFCSGVLMLDNC